MSCHGIRDGCCPATAVAMDEVDVADEAVVCGPRSQTRPWGVTWTCHQPEEVAPEVEAGQPGIRPVGQR